MIEIDNYRSNIAKRLWKMRKTDREFGYQMHRSGKDYIESFLGLQWLFEYVQTLTPNNVILDIGAGSTKGIAELSRNALAYDLSFQATVLTVSQDVHSNLGLDKTRVTSAEVLRGFKRESIGGVLALNSIAYSQAPEQALQKIDQVLVPGGVLKATFFYTQNLQTHQQFTEVLKSLGYGLATSGNDNEEDVVLAIKPGGPNNHRGFASILLDKDLDTLKQQITQLELVKHP